MVQNQEIIDLASEGFFYDKEHPFSSGKAYINVLSAKLEDILCNNNLKKRELQYETFMREVLVDKTINPYEILQCDVETILLNLRIASYGGSGKYNYECPACSTKNEHEMSFIFKSKLFNFSQIKFNYLEYKLPKSGNIIKYRIPTYKENLVYENLGWIEFIINQTVSIEDIIDVSEFYKNEMCVFDSKSFREYFFNNIPGFNTNYSMKCKSCQNEIKSKLDINCSIFGLSGESKHQIHEEIFFLCYGTNGGFQYSDVYEMPSSLRKFYLNKLVEVKKSESDSTKNQTKSTKAPNQLARPHLKK